MKKLIYSKSIKNCFRQLKSVFLILSLSLILSGGLIVRENKFELWTSYDVKKGDTLWSIALSCDIKDQDPIVTLGKIKDYNKLTTKTIYPGDELLIPVEIITDLDKNEH